MHQLMLHKILVKFISIILVFGVLAESNSFDGRIINGHDATDILPYHAHLRMRSANEPERIGSGVIITPRLIITTASNVYGFDTFLAGYGNIEQVALSWVFGILGTVITNYDPVTYENNIGFIIFQQNTFANDYVVPISIPPYNYKLNYPLVNEQGRIAGFGFTDTLGTFTDYLQIAFNRVLPDVDCYDINGVNQESNFCVIDTEGSSKICAGDQGAGFVTNINGQDYLTGIASFMYDFECVPGVPVVFERTIAFRNYIDVMVAMFR